MQNIAQNVPVNIDFPELLLKVKKRENKISCCIDELLSATIMLARKTIASIDSEANIAAYSNDMNSLQTLQETNLKSFVDEVSKLQKIIDEKFNFVEDRSKWKPQFDEIDMLAFNVDTTIKHARETNNKEMAKTKIMLQHLPSFGKWLELVTIF